MSDKAANQAGATHPLIASILSSMELSEQALHAGDAEKGMDHLIRALLKVKPADSPKELLLKIQQEYAYLGQLLAMKRNERMRLTVRYYQELTAEAWAVFWDKGYLSGEAYGFHDPSRGRRT